MEESITDGLTGVKTRRYLMEALHGEWRRSTRTGHRFSLIMVALDRFREVNGRMGRLEGDKVLTAVAALLEAGTRETDVVARIGGDEFAILTPETNTQQAEIPAERLRAAVEADNFLRAHKVTASFGIATLPDHGLGPGEILRHASSGVRLAKRHNGNCVKVASPSLEARDAEYDQN